MLCDIEVPNEIAFEESSVILTEAMDTQGVAIASVKNGCEPLVEAFEEALPPAKRVQRIDTGVIEIREPTLVDEAAAASSITPNRPTLTKFRTGEKKDLVYFTNDMQAEINTILHTCKADDIIAEYIEPIINYKTKMLAKNHTMNEMFVIFSSLPTFSQFLMLIFIQLKKSNN